MNSLYPLKFKPQFLEKIWGGTKLLKTYHMEDEFENIGEVWLLSAVKGQES
ncbi:MAG: mannose-6-phosphate isomerase, partial [Marinilabiliales bacterium]